MKRCLTSWFNVAEGGKRGGKNVLQTLIFCSLLETHKNRIHLIGGVSTATARLNILDCDGFGLLNYFEGRCRTGKFQNRDCVYVDTKTGEKIILISGGGKDGDEKLIKGNTYGMAYITEANECHSNFIKEVFDRTLSSDDRKVFHDLNPKAPSNWYYEEILNFHEEMQKQNPLYGYNYGHFTIADNMSIGEEKLRAILQTYDKCTVWYKRDILGQRTAAEGIIFKYFADNPSPYIITKKDLFDENGNCRFRFTMRTIGIDFGGNKSRTTYYCIGFVNNFQKIIVLGEDKLPIREEVDTLQIQEKFLEFFRSMESQYGYIQECFGDNAASTLIYDLKRTVRDEHLNTRMNGCDKATILERVRLVDALLRTGRLWISEDCTGLIKALSELKWDDKKEDEVEDLNIGSINDYWDGFNYAFTHYIPRLAMKY
jgi:PBSX family phage terminase large subunit